MAENPDYKGVVTEICINCIFCEGLVNHHDGVANIIHGRELRGLSITQDDLKEV